MKHFCVCFFFILDCDSMCSEIDFTPEKSFTSNYENVSSSWGQANSSNRRRHQVGFSTLFFLAFYKDRYKDEHGKIRRLFTWELSVHVCQDEWVRVCVLQHKRVRKLLLVRPRTTYWASRTSSERARTREASRTWQYDHQGQVCRETSHTLWSWTR